MPENLASITADKLCQILGVENLHIIDSTDGKHHLRLNQILVVRQK